MNIQIATTDPDSVEEAGDHKANFPHALDAGTVCGAVLPLRRRASRYRRTEALPVGVETQDLMFDAARRRQREGEGL